MTNEQEKLLTLTIKHLSTLNSMVAKAQKRAVRHTGAPAYSVGEMDKLMAEQSDLLTTMMEVVGVPHKESVDSEELCNTTATLEQYGHHAKEQGNV